VGACDGELAVGTNFEILAERGCEKQQAAEAMVFLLCFSMLRPIGSFRQFARLSRR
jgi:hypothetical protein